MLPNVQAAFSLHFNFIFQSITCPANFVLIRTKKQLKQSLFLIIHIIAIGMLRHAFFRFLVKKEQCRALRVSCG